jgi:predicted transcriptional regulator
MGATTTSLRLPEDVRDVYDTLVVATGRSRNDLMVEALRIVGEARVRELAMVQEGQRQLRAGLGIPLPALRAQLRVEGLLLDRQEEARDGNANGSA